jgi:hypothetical protein
MTVRPEPRSQLAFVYRNRAEKERQFEKTGGGPQLAFVYRDTAEMERQFQHPTGKSGR